MVACVVTLAGLETAIGGTDDDSNSNDGSGLLGNGSADVHRGSVEVLELWHGQLAIVGEVPPLRAVEEPLSVPPVMEPPEPTPLPVPRDEPQPFAEIETLSEVEAIICGVFGAYCYDALAVARCESLDYYAPFDGVHIGAFQVSARYHADKFPKYGFDYWANGNEPYANSLVAWEIFSARGYTWLGTSGWPNCGWEAGY